MKGFGEKIKKLRGNESIEAAAVRAGVTSSSWKKYEREERVPRDEVKIRIAEIYGASVESIFFAK